MSRSKGTLANSSGMYRRIALVHCMLRWLHPPAADVSWSRLPSLSVAAAAVISILSASSLES